MDFSCDEKKEDHVDVQNDESRDEESSKASRFRLDPAEFTTDYSIIICSNDSNEKAKRDSPTEQMIEFFISLDFLVPFHDHLIEVKCNNSTPTKIGDEKVMGDGSTALTK